MSNYLENLIAKSFNGIEVARPRLASRFESLPQNIPMMPGEIHPVGISDSALDNKSDDSQEILVELHRDSQQTTAGELSEEKIETSVWRRDQLNPQNVEPQNVWQPAAAQNRFELKSVAPGESEKAAQENDFAKLSGVNLKLPGMPPIPQSGKDAVYQDTALKGRTIRQQEETNSGEKNHQANAKNLLPIALHNTPTPIRKPLNALPAESEKKEASIASLSVNRQANKIQVQPRVAMRVEYQQSPDRSRSPFQQPIIQQTEPQVTPTINVTIGRIEVRATPPPVAPKRKPQSAAPTISLEEYLRRRDRGGAE
jgi:hypothetical protein